VFRRSVVGPAWIAGARLWLERTGSPLSWLAGMR